MEIQHLSHEHPLMFTEDHHKVVHDEDGKLRCCYGCLDPIFSTPSYSCSIEGCEFWVHKSCAELPLEIKHPLHPKHPLTLLDKSPYGVGFICNGCKSRWEWNTFVYHCSICKFDLDVGCASMGGHKIKHPSHHHPLTPHRKPMLALCDACGTKHEEDIFYHCSTCVQFWIHRECVSLPITIDHYVHHHHPLTLSYCLPSQYSKFDHYCVICNKAVKPQYWVYYCGQCKYFAHVNCATSKSEPFMSILLPKTIDDIETKYKDTRLDVIYLPVPHDFDLEVGCASVDNIEHFSHEHPLMFTEDHQKVVQDEDGELQCCYGCSEPIFSTPSYSCSIEGCEFWLHKSCAELPGEIKHPLHPKHPLTLLAKSPYRGAFGCDACNNIGGLNTFVYHCSLCSFDLHVGCASLAGHKIKHPSHHHPLAHLRKKILALCDACGTKHEEDIFYQCSTCVQFWIHRECASLPTTIDHSVHHHHPLTLAYSLPSQYSKFDYYCDICNKAVKPQYWVYYCGQCRYFAHLNCATSKHEPFMSIFLPKHIETKDVGCASMMGNKINHPSHHHQLIRLRKPILASCDACGTTHHQGIFYQCTTCVQFWIHRECAELKKHKIKHPSHCHDLTLDYSLPSKYSKFNSYCDICNKPVESQYWVYYCGQCRFFAHVNCATSIPLPSAKDDIGTKDEDTCLDVVHLPVPDETVSLVRHFRKGMINERTANDDEPIVHFSHKHPLILFHVQGNDDKQCSKAKLCEACVKPISVAPFYKCSTTHDQCNFFLHKCCAELPDEVRHPCHPQHPLILLPKSPKFFNFFLCHGCNFYCNGFTYSCADCDYYLDVECGSLPSTIKHEAHKNHLLSLKARISSHCNECDRVNGDFLFSYGCGNCPFELHASCALSPSTIRHRYDELHPFILTYTPVEDHSDDYYCDICETDLNPKWWFYHCVKCDKSMHPTCVPPFDKWSRIKFGGTLSIKTHPHPLTLVPLMGKGIQCNSRQVITQGTKCDHCSIVFDFWYTFAFKCFQCYFKLNFRCGQFLDSAILKDS